jgi:hypothetical protein
VERIARGTLGLVPPTLDQVILVKDTAFVSPVVSASEKDVRLPAPTPGKALP